MVLYALTILVSAFLLFQVEPVIAKIILPWFGGSAAVWTTCLLFFQMVLLLGYLYAHAVVRYFDARKQMLLHTGLLLASAIALPIYPSPAWKPSGTEEPTFAILKLLAVSVGLPYFLLSTTGPLVQAWYARRFKGAMPYRLYALSNAGSMFALVSYPVLFEPVFGVHLQAVIWSVAYAVFLVLCGFTALRSGQGAAVEHMEPAGPEHRPGARQYALWLLLPACASVLLLAVTNHLSQNVAAIPFLWVLPLSIYLLTFILCFEGSGWYRRNPYLQLLAVALGSMAYADGVDASGNVPIKILVPLFAIALFVCCMVCHGELARLKPHPRYLTHFYLMISAGGALGGLLVGFVAPRVFPALYELQIGLGACALLTLVVLSSDTEYAWFRQLQGPPQVMAAAVVAAGGGVTAYGFRGELLAAGNAVMRRFDTHWEAPENFAATVAVVALTLGLLLLLAAMRGGKARRQLGGLTVELIAMVLIGYLGFQVRGLTADYRLAVRNFYGALKVRDSGPASDLDATRTLTHGTINHGEQFLNPARRDLPTTYYGPNTGVGVAIREKGRGKAIRVGVIGLGTGTLAAYGRPGDYFRFYEINPLVLEIARTQFTFLNDCKAKLDVAMGDARLSLESEAQHGIDEHFDVLAVDAFSSDSIPVHLLTREAMQVYLKHLNPDGVLAIHISNRYLDLQPVVAGLAKASGRLARVVDTDDDDSQDVFGATWVLLAAPQYGFGALEEKASAEISSKRTVRLWTDDYSNLFQILK
ncbi:MAG TPA: fused MFS/spermidine synthase [Bryobacteraceae bacterium]|jgi:SAM-dependent methyltransferase|nr:fused MFS/spermidine synthase [Bryobacteraceae bacterium]